MAQTTVTPNLHTPETQPVVGSTVLELKYDPATGGVEVYQNTIVSNTVTKSDKIYSDGVWNSVPGSITSVKEKEEVHDKVKTEIKKAIAQSKGVPPPFVVNNEPSRDSRGPGNEPVPSQNSGGLFGTAQEILSNITGPPTFSVEFASANEKTVFGTAEYLRYPINILESNQDTFQISQFNYQASGGDIFTRTNAYSSVFGDGGLQRNSALLKKAIGTVILPMPNKVVDQNAIDWSGNALNSISMGVGGYAYQNTAEALGGQALAGLGGLVASIKGASIPPEVKTALIQAFTLMRADGGNIINRADMRAVLSSLALKGAGFDISPESILARAFGIVPNSNLELLFNGPVLRGFTFGYRMTPRSDKEARNVRRIIRFFKQGSAARKMTGQAGQGSAFLKSPNVFKLNYKSAGKPIPGVNKFKICALTQFGVDYTPESQWTAYEDPSSPGQPVSVIMNLQFNELEPVYESDYQDTNGIFKDLTNDLEPVTDNDVGY